MCGYISLYQKKWTLVWQVEMSVCLYWSVGFIYGADMKMIPKLSHFRPQREQALKGASMLHTAILYPCNQTNGLKSWCNHTRATRFSPLLPLGSLSLMATFTLLQFCFNRRSWYKISSNEVVSGMETFSYRYFVWWLCAGPYLLSLWTNISALNTSWKGRWQFIHCALFKNP